MRQAMTLAIVACAVWNLAAWGGENALKAELKDPDLAANWLYDDLPKALSDAKDSGKPLCVMLRCVPCVAGKKLDADAAHPNKELEALEKNFVCVRVIKT